MAVKIISEKSKYLFRDSDGREHFHAELWADEVSDIEGKVQFGNIIADPPSTAMVVNSAQVFALNNSGEWKEQGV